MGGGGILDSAVSPSTNWIMKNSFSKHAYTALYLNGGGGHILIKGTTPLPTLELLQMTPKGEWMLNSWRRRYGIYIVIYFLMTRIL